MNEAAAAPGSTVPRRQLGRYLRDLRQASRLTVRAAAAELEWSEAKIWRIETGRATMRSLDVEAMCRVYNAPPELTEALMGLAKETKARGWWHSYGDVIPKDFDVYIGLEESASHFSWYENELVPGLLQTEDYARALIAADNPDEDAEEIERRVNLRIARQTLLTRKAATPSLAVVLSEAILRRPIGGGKLLAAQLDRLVEISQLPNVELRMVPFSADLHPGVMSGPFVILQFPVNGDGRSSEPPTVYFDGYTGALYLDKDSEIARYDAAFSKIWASSLDEARTQDVMSAVARELRQ